MDKITIPDLNGTNYFIWELKMKAALSLKRLVPLILEEKPEDLTRKDEMDWITKNSDAIAYIKFRSQMSKPYSSRRKTTRKCCGIKLERLTWAKLRTVIIETRTLQVQAKEAIRLEMDTYLQLPIEKKNFVTISGFWIVVHPVIWPKNLCGSKNISPEVMDIYLADKNSKMMSQGTGNVSAKTDCHGWLGCSPIWTSTADFFQHLWPYIGNNTANVVFQMVKRLWLIRIDQ
ncbi:RBR-type E3 ubiquitin transferase [Trichonephila clavipes]|nr:RBR-type E3 ubiquitin transferase [Trichonephila clavipes]